jgi:hypothetical protein
VRRLAFLLAALAIVAGGCMGDDDGIGPEDDLSRLSSAELGWIRGYSSWSIAIYDHELGPPTGSRLVRVCRERLEEIGPTPTERLQSALDMSGEVCPLLGDDGTRRRALDLVDAIDDALRPLLRDEQELELGTGPSDGSRADTAFSAYATSVVGDPVEVRCWSEGDWRRVVIEDNAWNDVNDDPVTLYGWADDGDDRIHMRLEQCNAISRLAELGTADRSEAARSTAADALGTLAHEIQHFLLPDAGEAKVECAAVRAFATGAERLGLDRASAVALADFYRTEIYPEQPEEYTRGGCPAVVN